MTSLFKRAPESERRRELIEATLECISEVGIQATTVRAVAARAGVTNGLIRHHFENKANLIVEAYRRTMELITASSMAILEGREGNRISGYCNSSRQHWKGKPPMIGCCRFGPRSSVRIAWIR